MTGLVLGGDGGTAYGAPPSHYGLATDPATLPRDITLLVGRARADYLVGSIPDVTIGESTTFDLGFDPDGLPGHLARYNALRDLIHHANDAAVATGTTQDGTPWFAEQHSRAPLLVKVLPGRDLDEVRGVWGLIEGGSDATTLPGAQARLSVDVLVLADVDAYGSYNAVREDLER